MEIITLDAETFFGDDYTLSKLTTEEYIRDPRFEAHGWGVRLPDGQSFWLDDAQFRTWAKTVDWSKFAVLCHHAHFDGLILSHCYGIIPGAWLDTLSMARFILGNHLRVGLDALAKHFHLAAKNVPYHLFKNKRWAELDPGVRQLVADGCLHDLALTYDIFCRLAAEFPVTEYPIVDMTVRMFTEPKLLGDTAILGRLWHAEELRKREALAALGVGDDDLQSAEKFAALLRAEGAIEESLEELEEMRSRGANLADLPYLKQGKNATIYAFAQNDEFMRELVESPNPRISMLANARLDVKSTLDQTRAARLGNMAMRGPMCIYLSYCAAHTTRWGGGDKVNYQNFTRGGDLRLAHKAPPGYKLIIADSSQIECRKLNVLAGQWDVVEKFRQGIDIYSELASLFYGFPVTKANPKERGTGKQLELSCGYGSGAKTIVTTARAGTYGPPVILTEEQGLEARNLYRSTHPHVVEYWKAANKMLCRIASHNYPPTQWGPMTIQGGKVYGPNGTWLNYTTLEYCQEWKAWRMRKRNGWTKMYGGKLVENIVQWLARIQLTETIARIKREIPDIILALTVHDELVYCVPDDSNVNNKFEIIKREMVRPPLWMPDIPLACEASISERYDK